MAFDREKARQCFESSTDFTVGLEEEFGLLDPETLSLAHRFDDLFEAASRARVLTDSGAGGLVGSGVEGRSGAGGGFGDRRGRQRERRRRLFALAGDLGISL